MDIKSKWMALHLRTHRSMLPPSPPPLLLDLSDNIFRTKEAATKMDIATATTVLSIIVLASHAQAAAAQSLDNNIPQCAFLNTPEQPQRVGSGDSAGGLQTVEEKANVEEQVVTCDKATNFCFTLWLEDGSGNQTIIKQ
ncbi:hypothetical protein B566_EDAN010530, partial [Ephemera danica]